jgi:hypothetical protein
LNNYCRLSSNFKIKPTTSKPTSKSKSSNLAIVAISKFDLGPFTTPVSPLIVPVGPGIPLILNAFLSETFPSSFYL